jgi:signal transduction histidine kinase
MPEHSGSSETRSHQPDVLASVLDVARRVLQADGFAIWRLDRGAWTIRAYAGVSADFANQSIGHQRSVPVGPLEATEPLVFNDIRQTAILDERRAALEQEGVCSMAAVPLIIAGRYTASLALYYRSLHQFTQTELETARALGQTASAALTAAELHEQQQLMRERLAFLDRASVALAESLDLRTTAQTVTDLAVPFFADTCAIHVPGPDGEVRLVAASHVDTSKRAAMLVLAARARPNRHRGWGRTIVDGTVELFEEIDPVAVRQALGDDPKLNAAFAEVALVSQLSVPMQAHGRLVGAMTFALQAGPRRYAAGDIEFAQDLARRCALAIDNARLYEEAQRREADAAWAEHRATFLAEAAAALASSLDYDDTLRTVARLAVPRIADWCAVDMVDDGGAVKRLAVTHIDPAKVELAQTIVTRYEEPDSPLGVPHVIRTAAPVMVPRITDAMIVAAARGDAERIALVRALGLSSYMCVPLIVQGRAIGAISFVTGAAGRQFTDSDLRFAQDVASRTALAVENSRAYAEARRANHLKDEFLATLSHELRTPLNAILGYSRMLRDGSLAADKQTRAIAVVERNASALAQIVGDILDVSSIIAGKLRLDLKTIDVPALMHDAIAAILPAADAKGVRVAVDIDPQLGQVAADPDRLQQIVWNLVANAVKFTPRDGNVEVSVKRDGETVAIAVTDTGAGIQPEFLPYVFERFRQGDARFTREHGGLGLGLAIARHLVEMHGGTISASSEGGGRGASFQVRMPLAPQAGRATSATMMP